MAIKFSEIEKVTEKKMVIENGKPYWIEPAINGEINFKQIDEEMIKNIREKALDKFNKAMTDEEAAYLLIPFITDVEDDIDLDRFGNMIKNKNDIVLTLVDGVLDLFDGIIEFSAKISQIIDRSQAIQDKMPEVDIKELQRQELEELYKKFAIVSDNKERDMILKRIIELKNELGE